MDVWPIHRKTVRGVRCIVAYLLLGVCFTCPRHANTILVFSHPSKRIGFDGTSKTPSLALLKPTASSLGHRVAKVSAFQYSSKSTMKVSPNQNKDFFAHQQCIDNNADKSHIAMDSSLNQYPPLDPFRNVFMEGGPQHSNSPDGKCTHLDNREANSHLSPAKRPLDHSPFPTPLQRRQSEPVVKFERGGINNNNRGSFRSHVFDPVASQLLDQEDVFVSFSSSDEPMMADTDLTETESVDCNLMRYNSLPNITSSPISPVPRFCQVSGSLHEVKTDDDLNLLARPIPRKLS